MGNIVLFITASLSLIAAACFFVSHKGSNEKLLKWGEVFFYAAAAGVLFLSVFLMVNILRDNFSFTYIWSYSSKELPLFLKVSSFFSGQEGSFLLWSLFLSVIGVIFVRSERGKPSAALSLGIFSVIMLFVLLMLIAKSPFNYVWDTFTGEGLQAGFTPDNGRGLNPILQNFWIVIHPPVLFLGYAIMSAPFALAVSALFRREYEEWAQSSIRWNLWGSAILGIGIMLGGFWAYETLGWGGFWGWDPVENSSLLPWLVAVALAHTLLIQKRTGGLKRTNFALAIVAFLLVIYATFLTRSGVLGDMSVHSFGDPGNYVYALLLTFLAVFALIGFIPYFTRFKEMGGAQRVAFQSNSREFMISLGVLFLLISSVIIFIGTSWPIITSIIGANKSSVDVAFYNRWNLPVALGLLVTNVLSLWLSWRAGEWKPLLKRLGAAFIAALIIAVVVSILHPSTFHHALLLFAALWGLLANADYAARIWKRYSPGRGAVVSHIGISLFVLGVIASGVYERNVQVTLALGESKKALDGTIKFIGKEQIEKSLTDREKYKYKFEYSEGGDTKQVSAVIYWSDFNMRQSPFFEPGILRGFIGDVYVEPRATGSDNESVDLSLSKKELRDFPGDTALKLKLTKFEMAHAQVEDGSSKNLGVGIVIEGTYRGEAVQDTLLGMMDMEQRQIIPVWKNIAGAPYIIAFTKFNLSGMSLEGSEAVVSIAKEGEAKAPRETVTFELKKKPLIWFVWLGTILTMGGFIIALARHKNKQKNSKNEREIFNDTAGKA
ncbi:MAG: heme lyase CcmF/NrfE family subunit [Chloroflexota bacterium]